MYYFLVLNFTSKIGKKYCKLDTYKLLIIKLKITIYKTLEFTHRHLTGKFHRHENFFLHVHSLDFRNRLP